MKDKRWDDDNVGFRASTQPTRSAIAYRVVHAETKRFRRDSDLRLAV